MPQAARLTVPFGRAPRTPPLPADDPELATLTLDELELRWSAAAARTAITAEAMTGADLKAQALGTPGETLMEHAGTAVAAAARALVAFNGREGKPVLILAGPGNNGGDGFVAARDPGGVGDARDRRPRGRGRAPRHPRRAPELEAPRRR